MYFIMKLYAKNQKKMFRHIISMPLFARMCQIQTAHFAQKLYNKGSIKRFCTHQYSLPILVVQERDVRILAGYSTLELLNLPLQRQYLLLGLVHLVNVTILARYFGTSCFLADRRVPSQGHLHPAPNGAFSVGITIHHVAGPLRVRVQLILSGGDSQGQLGTGRITPRLVQTDYCGRTPRGKREKGQKLTPLANSFKLTNT